MDDTRSFLFLHFSCMILADGVGRTSRVSISYLILPDSVLCTDSVDSVRVLYARSTCTCTCTLYRSIRTHSIQSTATTLALPDTPTSTPYALILVSACRTPYCTPYIQAIRRIEPPSCRRNGGTDILLCSVRLDSGVLRWSLTTPDATSLPVATW